MREPRFFLHGHHGRMSRRLSDVHPYARLWIEIDAPTLADIAIGGMSVVGLAMFFGLVIVGVL